MNRAPSRILFLLSFILIVASGCNKDELIIDDNTAPPDSTVSTLIVENYVNKCYISLLGREPFEQEEQAAISTLTGGNFSVYTRKTMLDEIIDNPEYRDKILENNSLKLLNAPFDTTEIQTQLYIYNSLLNDPQYAQFYDLIFQSAKHSLNMLQTIESFLSQAVSYIWGLPTILLLVLSGLLLSVILGGLMGGIQRKAFFHGIQVVRGKYDKPDDPGEISHFQALMTALSATIGLGNIGIVAIIIKYGGPGAVFWMIVAGVIGMATKYAESTLAILFRKIDKDGVVHGGPMYYMELGLGKQFKPMAKFYALSIAIGSFGIANMFQTNQSAVILNQSFGVPHYITGLVMMILGAFVIIGGIKRIAKVTSVLVPIMAVTYVVGCLIVIGFHVEKIPGLIMTIVTSAFSDTGIAGGAVATMHMAILQGVKRACFSNEAGLGSAAIAHSAAATTEPVREGVVALLEPFIDTVVICTLTALVILTTGVWESSDLVGVPLTAAAFDTVIEGFGYYYIPVAATFFAFSTLISWSYYGETAIYYLTGKKGILPYKVIFCIVAYLGTIWKIQAVLDFSDIMTGMMVFPNIVAIWLLLPHLKKQTKRYFNKLGNGDFESN